MGQMEAALPQDLSLLSPFQHGFMALTHAVVAIYREMQKGVVPADLISMPPFWLPIHSALNPYIAHLGKHGTKVMPAVVGQQLALASQRKDLDSAETGAGRRLNGSAAVSGVETSGTGDLLFCCFSTQIM